MTLLSPHTLAQASPSVARPGYDPGAIATGVVHFGPGAFHRAHQAAYFDTLLRKDPRWGITAVALRTPGTVRALAAQDGLYTLAIRDREPSERVLAPHRRWFGPGDGAAALALFDDPGISLITVTATEKGYCLGPNRTLNFEHPDIIHDLRASRAGAPRSLPGRIVVAMRCRRAGGLSAPTVLSCDDLPGNGDVLRKAVIALAREGEPDLARWIADEAAFPNSIVDAITPASSDALLNDVERRVGLRDTIAVERDSFSQWVIGAVPAGFPDLASAGAEVGGDVAAWERAKLRMLDGARSSLAYLGLPRGHATIADAAGDADLIRFVRRMVMDEIIPTLVSPAGADLAAYGALTFARLANPTARQRLDRIAIDGTRKVPQRLVAPLLERRRQGLGAERLVVALGGWMAFCAVRARHGLRIDDPYAAALARAGAMRDPRDAVRAFLSVGTVFPATLRAADDLVEPLAAALTDTFTGRQFGPGDSLYHGRTA